MNAVSSTDYIELNDKTLVNIEFENISKKAIVA
jgi:hypothetical protein